MSFGYEREVSKFLVKDKKGMDLDEFSQRFYRSLKLNQQIFDENQYDEFLKELYMKEPDVYNDWYKTFGKITYKFARKNVDLLTDFVAMDNMELALVAFEMDKTKRQLVSRCIPRKATTSSVNESKEELIVSLNTQLSLLDSDTEDNILKVTQDKFELCYGEYKDNIYLRNLYNEIMDSFEKEIRKSIINEINKIDGLSNRIIETLGLTIFNDDMQNIKRNRRTPKVYKRN